MQSLIASLLGVGLAAAAAWLAVAARFYARLKSFMPLAPSSGPADSSLPAVDVVVAARNEELNVEATVAALARQNYPRLALVVVDDQSSDRTPEILASLSAAPNQSIPLRVVHGVDRPEGWAGKTWALHQGVAHTQADWLLFVDADMRLDPRAVTTAVRHAQSTQTDLVSLLPRPECDTFWQGAIAIAVLQLLAHRYPLDLVARADRPEALASGGFILVRRDAYVKAGGHLRLRRAILDDIELARRVKLAGGTIRAVAAPELASTHMYGSFKQIWQGLRKNAYAGMHYRFYKYAVGSLLGLLLVWTPWLALLVGTTGLPSTYLLMAAGLMGVCGQALASYPFVRFLRIRPAMALSPVAGLTAYIAIATASVWHHVRGRVLWKDRSFNTTLVKTRVPYPNLRAEGAESLPRPHTVESQRAETSRVDQAKL